MSVNNCLTVNLEFKRVKCGIFAETRPQFGYRPTFGTLAF